MKVYKLSPNSICDCYDCTKIAKVAILIATNKEYFCYNCFSDIVEDCKELLLSLERE